MKKLACAVMAFIMSVAAFCPSAYAGKSNRLDISKSNISHEVSPTLYGISLEDISNSFDGGLSSNLVNNNSFEYATKPDFGWDFDNIKATTENKKPLNALNTNYQAISVNGKGIVRNLGFTEYYDGSQNNFNKDKSLKADMPFKKDTNYDFGCYLRNVDFEGTISVYLDSPTNSHRINQLNTSGLGDKKWSYLYTTLSSIATEDGALAIEFDGKGTILLDFVTLVSQDSHGYRSDSWKYTTVNSDLYNSLLNLKPAFVRFYLNGLGKDSNLQSLYNWKDTIGPLENRKQNTNYYANDKIGEYYNSSNFFGMHECLQLSKDLGARAIPVVNVGVVSSKQGEYELYNDALNKLSMSEEHWQAYLTSEKDFNSKEIEEYTSRIDELEIKSREDYDRSIEKIALTPGTDEFLNYAQDILDLIEYANGDSKTSYWGALRGSNGSSETLDIEYIALGNNNFGDIYLRNFEALYSIIKQKYPDITIIACGDDNGDTYKEISSKYSDVIVDEHFEAEKDAMYENNMRYDGYDRQKSGIMLSSYGVKTVGRDTDISNDNLMSALEQASFMTALERDSDVVKFSCANPTMAKINAQDNNHSLIWFDSQSIVLTPNYFVKMLFSNNVGTKYVSTQKISDDIYQSVTIDEQAQTIFIKLVNKGAKELVNINLTDFENINCVSKISLSNNYLSAYNKLNVKYIAPEENNIEHSENSFDVKLDKNSVNVVRIAYGDNDAQALYEIPDESHYDTSYYLPQDIRVGLVSVIVVTIILAIGISIFLKKYEAYKRKNK